MKLEIENLTVEIEEKKILDDFSLKLEDGNIYALMGKNGSGKSTFANVLMGNTKYKITSGKILLNKEDITKMPIEERAKRGIFMSFQVPTEISGVTFYDFLRTSYNSVNKKISILEFDKLLKEKCKLLDINEEFIHRYLNRGFSGGEKKKSEMLQLLVLNPKIIVLDEIDSGLDIDALKIISRAINSLDKKNKIILIISHYKRIFEEITPNKVFVVSNGRIKVEGNNDIIEKIDNLGYSMFNNN